jgi:hypothetical protein
MSKSPLSGAFADSSATTKKKNKKNGAILLIAGIALTSSIGGVFAANSITLNTNNTLEFGQGAATASACDSAITTSITQDLATGATTSFVVRTVELSGITSDCDGKKINIGLYDANTSTAIASTSVNRSSGAAATYSWDLSGVSPRIDAGTVRRIAITTENQ